MVKILRNTALLWMGVFCLGLLQAESLRDPFSTDSTVKVTPTQSKLVVVQHREAKEITELLQSWRKQSGQPGQMLIDTKLNAVLLEGTPGFIFAAENLVRTLDKAIGQVSIEAKMVVVSEDASSEVGARLGFRYMDGFFQLGINESLKKTSQAPLSYRAWLDLELAAMEKEGLCEVVSSPRVLTANRQEAVIESGEEIPFKTTATSEGVTQYGVDFKKAVLALRVLPSITPQGQVTLNLDVHQDSRGEETPDGPTIDTQKIKTQVTVNNGETIVLGGVFQRTEVVDEVKTPILGDIPLLGYFFRKTKKINKKQELLVFVTPKIMK